MITYLRAWFRPEMAECPEFSLGISVGNQGARLSHNHERQYNYVLQSLTLWREARTRDAKNPRMHRPRFSSRPRFSQCPSRRGASCCVSPFTDIRPSHVQVATDMFKLWCLAEEDLLKEGNNYRLVDTGQGLNRIQQAPLVGREIHRILQRCQQTLGTWVGSSVVHLGDHNVPNALMFIDKYIQARCNAMKMRMRCCALCAHGRIGLGFRARYRRPHRCADQIEVTPAPVLHLPRCRAFFRRSSCVSSRHAGIPSRP